MLEGFPAAQMLAHSAQVLHLRMRQNNLTSPALHRASQGLQGIPAAQMPARHRHGYQMAWQRQLVKINQHSLLSCVLAAVRVAWRDRHF